MSIHILTFNVEHGNCHAIWSPSGKLVLIDLGSSDDFSPIAWLKSQKIQTVDLMVLTHPHDDHIRGFRDLDGVNVKALYRPKNIPAKLTADLDRDLKQAWDRYDTGYTGALTDADKFYDNSSSAFDGLSLKFFGGWSSSDNLNNYSVVTVLEYAGFKVIFPGDLENLGWTELLRDQNFRSAISGTNILVAAHHGREAGWCSDLFKYISPQLVLISDGSETDTSYASQYSQKARGAQVVARQTSDQKVRYVVSTRDNGHIDVSAAAANGNCTFAVRIDRH